jgi:Flp pilus assembly pilin Flp
MLRFLRRLIKNQIGAVSVEYLLIASLISVAAIGALSVAAGIN